MPVLRRLLLLPALVMACLPLATHAQADRIQWQPPLEIAKGPGERGPWRQNDSRFRYVDDGTVRFGPDGTLHTAWVNQVQKDVLFQRRDANGRVLEQPINVSRNPDSFSWLPRIASLPDRPEVVLVLWQEIIFAGGAHGGDIMLARSADGGISFSQPLNLSRSIGGDGKGRINRDTWHNGSQDIVAGPDGMVHAAWTEYDGQLWHARSRDGGISFDAPRQVAGSRSRPARAPALAVAPNGDLALAFTTGEDPASDIQLMQSKDQGESFSAPHVVEQTPGYSDAPKLAIDDRGVLHLVWAQCKDGPSSLSRIRYARSRDGGASFEVSRELPAADKSDASSAFPALALQGGRVLLLWETLPAIDSRPRGLGMAVSEDGGDSFAAPFIVPDSRDAKGGFNGSVQGLLMQKLASTREGGIAIVNSALKDGHASRVWLLRGRLPASR